MEKVNKIKKILLRTPWKFEDMEDISDTISFHVTNSADEMGQMASTFLRGMKFSGYKCYEYGRIIKCVVGYDMAYRLRLQDMLNETCPTQLERNPRKEIKRLWSVYERRESIIPTYMIPKSRKLYRLLMLALLVPRVRRSFVRMVQCTDWDRLKWTEQDTWWIAQRTDYDFNA